MEDSMKEDMEQMSLLIKQAKEKAKEVISSNAEPTPLDRLEAVKVIVQIGNYTSIEQVIKASEKLMDYLIQGIGPSS